MTLLHAHCADAIDAVGFAMHLQEALMEAPWPEEILTNPHACLFTTPSGQELFNGLRVRLAIHTGIPSSVRVCALHFPCKAMYHPTLCVPQWWGQH